MNIRPIAPDEEDRFIERVIENAWLALPEAVRSQRSIHDIAPSLRELIPLLMAQGDNVILVADEDGQRNVGQAWLGQARDPYTGTMRGFLYDLFVDSAWRGKGVGQALLAAAEAAARSRGDAELGLAVAADNEVAQRLYATHGFETERLMLLKAL